MRHISSDFEWDDEEDEALFNFGVFLRPRRGLEKASREPHEAPALQRPRF